MTVKFELRKLYNRNGDEYSFSKINEYSYTIIGNLKYWRFGGQEGQSLVDTNDLGFVDPSGGPFIQLGMYIGSHKIVRISVVDSNIDNIPHIVFGIEQ